MSAFNFRFVKDDFSEYLSELEALSKDESNQRNFLNDASYELHARYIAPLMSTWNPNLINSPMESKNRIFEYGDEISSLEMLYTGFTEEALSSKGLEHIFWEFAVNFDKTTKHLARDYAYFQETGIDSVVNPKEYTPRNLHFVERGTKEYETEFHYKTMAYLMKLLNLERWERVNKPFDLYDFE